MAGEKVELGVELLSKLEFESVTLPDALDRIEAVTTDPATQRLILECAVERGVVEREGDRILPRSGAFVRFESDVVTKAGEFSCRRCGAELASGHFIRFEAGELGPFGSSCVRKVTGRG